MAERSKSIRVTKLFNQRPRAIIALIVLLLVALLATRCVPEKEVDLATKITPINWLSEDELLVRQGNAYFIRTSDGQLTPSEFQPAYPPKYWVPDITISPTVPGAIWSEKVYSGDTHLRSDKYMMIEGEKHRITQVDFLSRQRGMNQGFPRMPYFNFYYFRHLGKIGLLTFNDGAVQKIELPVKDPGNKSLPLVIKDSTAKMFFAFQTHCKSKEPKGTCLRTAWWLSEDLEVLSSFLLPTDDPLYVREKFACFSCGCSCYTQEDAYAVNGQAYFQISGWPIAPSTRGLYRVVEDKQGQSDWIHEVQGRIEPPLAFSPSGCKVAYFEVSRLGDELKVHDLCP